MHTGGEFWSRDPQPQVSGDHSPQVRAGKTVITKQINLLHKLYYGQRCVCLHPVYMLSAQLEGINCLSETLVKKITMLLIVLFLLALLSRILNF